MKWFWKFPIAWIRKPFSFFPEFWSSVDEDLSERFILKFEERSHSPIQVRWMGLGNDGENNGERQYGMKTQGYGRNKKQSFF
jgi:hypothetical protein